MSTNLLRLVNLLIIVNFIRVALSVNLGYYTVVAPGIVRSQSVYHVSISLSDFHQSCWFNLSINIRDQASYFLGTVEVQPSKTKLVKLKTPFLNGTRGSFEVIGYRGIISKDSSAINIQQRPYVVFIQTSKPKYKPGELVQFRVIFVDLLTRPAKVKEEISVLIYDGSGNLLKQFNGVKLVQGVFKNEIQLSEYPVLGDWKIEVKANGDAGDKSFEVSRYVLPKFAVNIDTKANVAVSEGTIAVTVSASYFYKEPVKGNLTLLVENSLATFGKNLPTIKKESLIDGEIKINLDISKDLHVGARFASPLKLYTMDIKAIVTDELTEQQSIATTEVSFHSQAYRVKLRAPELFDPEKLDSIKVLVSITDLQHIPIQDFKNPVKIISECSNSLGGETNRNEYLHQLAMEFFLFNITDPNISECKLYGEYRGSRSYAVWTRRNDNIFSLDVLTESPEVGKELRFELKSKKPIEFFAYEVVSRGDILQAEHINVPTGVDSYIVRINTTHAMVPKLTLYVHRTKNRVFDSVLKEVFIKRDFQNSIKIETVDEAKPGDLVSVKIATDEGSYVGIMGIDQSLLQSQVNTNDLTEDLIYAELQNFDASSIDDNPGIKAGVLTFSNAIPHLDVGTRLSEVEVTTLAGVPAIFQEARIRKMFSDSWIYNDFERSPRDGLRLMEIVPDTITSWAISGFSLNPNTGLTLTKNVTELRVFQDFFISMDLPSVVKAGESIEVPVYVSNYMARNAMTNVVLEKLSEDLEILEYRETDVKHNQTISKLIKANGREKFVVVMRPRKPGQFKVMVTAYSASVGDAVEKTLNVVSEGIPSMISKKYLIHFLEESIQEDALPIELPKNIVAGSENVEISVVGDVFGPLMESLKKSVRVPYGDGEENMKVFIANLLVLKYLKALNYSNVSLENRIRFNLELGYQNQLSFRHLDGSFRRFVDNKSARTGDVWQTAFALWGLKQASFFIKIDKKVLDRGLNYLKRKQQDNGCLKSGKGVEEDVKLTAFGLMVFLIDETTRTSYRDVIAKGFTFLYENLDNLEHSSTSVLATYVLLRGKHAKSSELMSKLSGNTQLASKQLFWSKSDTLQSQLEATAGSLLSLFESQRKRSNSLLHVVRGLMSSEGHESSVTHMIALQAMIAFVGEMEMTKKGLSITFDNEKGISGNFHVNSSNAQVLQTIKLSPNSRKIRLKSQGHGFAIVDVRFRYNLLPEQQVSPLYVTNIRVQSTSKYLTVLQVCLTVNTKTNQNKITVVEVNLQSGYSFTEKLSDDEGDTDDDYTEDTTKVVKTVRISNNRDVAVAYFENISTTGECIELEALKLYKVFNSRPGVVVAYDAYKEDEKTVNSFMINETSLLEESVSRRN